MEGCCRSGTSRRKLKRVRCGKSHCAPDAECILTAPKKTNLSTSSWQNTDYQIAPSPDPLSPAVVCSKTTKHPPVFPFLCMDMTYITCLLKDGFGFKESTVLQVRPCQIRRLRSQNILLEYRLFFSLHLVEQEGEQCGVELGFGRHIRPFLQPEYPLK